MCIRDRFYKYLEKYNLSPNDILSAISNSYNPEYYNSNRTDDLSDYLLQMGGRKKPFIKFKTKEYKLIIKYIKHPNCIEFLDKIIIFRFLNIIKNISDKSIIVPTAPCSDKNSK